MRHELQTIEQKTSWGRWWQRQTARVVCAATTTKTTTTKQKWENKSKLYYRMMHATTLILCRCYLPCVSGLFFWCYSVATHYYAFFSAACFCFIWNFELTLWIIASCGSFCRCVVLFRCVPRCNFQISVCSHLTDFGLSFFRFLSQKCVCLYLWMWCGVGSSISIPLCMNGFAFVFSLRLSACFF